MHTFIKRIEFGEQNVQVKNAYLKGIKAETKKKVCLFA